MHLVHLSTNLMNKTMHPELAQYVCSFYLSYLSVRHVWHDVVMVRACS